MEVSRYRPRSVRASLLATLCCAALVVALGGWGWIGCAQAATAAGIAAFLEWLFRPRRLLEQLVEGEPLPIGAVDVSDYDKPIFAEVEALLVGVGVTTAGMALLFHVDPAAMLWIFAGTAAGSVPGALRDNRTLKRWESFNGRVFVERRGGFRRKFKLFVEDPAVAPLDAS